jgi:CRP-like cAMP-binding protein
VSGADLKHFAIFGDLSEDERVLVEDLLKSRTLCDGETLFQEGEEGDGLALLASGQLHVKSRRSPEGGDLYPGASLGALSLFRVGVREVEVVSVGTSDVHVLRREDFRRLVEDDARAACRVVEAILVELAAQANAALDALDGGTPANRPQPD